MALLVRRETEVPMASLATVVLPARLEVLVDQGFKDPRDREELL